MGDQAWSVGELEHRRVVLLDIRTSEDVVAATGEAPARSRAVRALDRGRKHGRRHGACDGDAR